MPNPSSRHYQNKESAMHHPNCINKALLLKFDTSRQRVKYFHCKLKLHAFSPIILQSKAKVCYSCAGPESFVRGCPTLTTTIKESSSQIAGIRWAHVDSRWKCVRQHTNVEPIQQCQLFLSQVLFNNSKISQNPLHLYSE